MCFRSILTAVAAAALCSCSAKAPDTYQGYVEGEFVHVGSPVAGRLEQLLVRRGDAVEPGTPLFVLEADPEAGAAREAEERLRTAEAELADLQKGERDPEIDVVRAQLEAAKTAERNSALVLARAQKNFAAELVPESDVDDARARHDIDAARVRELGERLAVSRLPARADRLRAKEAEVEAAREAAAQVRWRLEQKKVAASAAGVVNDTLYREGEWVAAGNPVVRILPPDHVKVRFFVPQAVAGGLAPGRAVVVSCDGCAGEIPATVTFLSTEAEFTPPVIYSNETRDKLVFLVEARPAVEDAPRLRPGQPVAVALR